MEKLEKDLSMEEKAIKEAEKIIASIKSQKEAEEKGQISGSDKVKDNTKKEAPPTVDTPTKKKLSSSNQKTKHKSKRKKIKAKNKKIILCVIAAIIVSALLVLSTIFGIITSSSNKIVSGVSVKGIDLSNLTQTEAIEKLTAALSYNLCREITLTHGDYTTSLQTSTINPNYNIQDSVDKAFAIGRSGNNIFSNNLKVIQTYIGKTNIVPEISYSDELLDEKIEAINNELPDKAINSSYEIKDNNLIISSNSDGYKVQNDALKTSIYSALANDESSVEIPVEAYHTDEVDIDAIYNAVHKEPVDASFQKDTMEVHKEENGLDFAISLEKARTIVAQEQESYTIPLKVLTPKVTVKSLPQEAFPDMLATYSTTYASSNYNRSTNIALATKSVNGCVLMPGETFSYNTTVGQRTAARGYKEAGVYVNGEVSTDYGGGICQVSSTLYNAVLLCNLEIVARTNHTFEPSYVPAGQDATVSWTSPDFQFKNNRNYPIRISAVAGNGRVSFNIYGLKSDDDYQVKIESSKVGTVPFSTEYRNDASIPAGSTKVIQAGSNGCKTQTYKVLYKDGVEVSRTLINSDTYKPHNQVVAKGTGAVSTPSETPSDNSTESPANTDNTGVLITSVPQ